MYQTDTWKQKDISCYLHNVYLQYMHDVNGLLLTIISFSFFPVLSSMQRQRVAARMVASSSSNVDEDTLSNISINLTDSELSYCDRFQVGPDELPLESQFKTHFTTLYNQSPFSKNAGIFCDLLFNSLFAQ